MTGDVKKNRKKDGSGDVRRTFCQPRCLRVGADVRYLPWRSVVVYPVYSITKDMHKFCKKGVLIVIVAFGVWVDIFLLGHPFNLIIQYTQIILSSRSIRFRLLDEEVRDDHAPQRQAIAYAHQP